MIQRHRALVRRIQRRRRGTTLVELAVVVPIVFLLLLGTLDMSMLVYAYSTVSEAARAGARYAIVHGSASSSPSGPTANDANVASAVQSYAPGLNTANLSVTSTWPSGSNDPTRSVTVTATYNYQLMVGRLFGVGNVQVSGTSTMLITH